MNWYYAADNRQQGPVSEADFNQLVAAGAIREDTLVWREGMASWVPYSQAAANLTPPATPPSGAPVVCSECRKEFPPGEVIQYGDVFVCATCKPVFVQRLREGVNVSRPGALTVGELLARDYEVRIGDHLNKAFSLVTSNFGTTVGATFLVYLAVILAGMIPYIGWLVGMILNGPLLGGLYFLFIRLVRDSEGSISDAFSGFGPGFLPLMWTRVITTLIYYACLIPGGILFVLAFGVGFLRGQVDAESVSTGIALAGIAVMLLGVLVMGYLSVCWLYALPLVADKGMAFWPAMCLSMRMVNKHWFMTFVLLMVVGVLVLLGFLACLIGILFAAPVCFALIVYQYQAMFGDLANQEHA